MDNDRKHAREVAQRNERLVTPPDMGWQRAQDLQNEHRRERERLDAEARKRNGW